MAEVVQKSYLDLEGLKKYDANIKKWEKENAKNADYKTTTVEGATVTLSIKEGLDALDEAVKKLGNDSEIFLDTATTATEGYLKTYILSQGKNASGEKIEVGKIDIPKDYLVKEAKLVKFVSDPDTGKYYDEINDPTKTKEIDILPTGVTANVEYIDFVINSKDGTGEESHVYLNVTTLVNTYTGKNANGITVTVDGTTYEISAAINDASIARTKIDTTFESDVAKVETALNKKADGTYNDVDTRIKNAVEALDATIDNKATDKTTADSGCTISIEEEDGKLKSVSAAITDITEAEINALFA